MNLFQIFLIIVSLILLFFYTKYFKRLNQRLFYTCLFLVGLYFIIFPNTTNFIAAYLGVGRGADLIFYIFIMFCLTIFVQQYQRIQLLEKSITELVRHQAIREVKKLNKKN